MTERSRKKNVFEFLSYCGQKTKYSCLRSADFDAGKAVALEALEQRLPGDAQRLGVEPGARSVELRPSEPVSHVTLPKYEETPVWR